MRYLFRKRLWLASVACIGAAVLSFTSFAQMPSLPAIPALPSLPKNVSVQPGVDASAPTPAAITPPTTDVATTPPAENPAAQNPAAETPAAPEIATPDPAPATPDTVPAIPLVVEQPIAPTETLDIAEPTQPSDAEGVTPSISAPAPDDMADLEFIGPPLAPVSVEPSVTSEVPAESEPAPVVSDMPALPAVDTPATVVETPAEPVIETPAQDPSALPEITAVPASPDDAAEAPSDLPALPDVTAADAPEATLQQADTAPEPLLENIPALPSDVAVPDAPKQPEAEAAAAPEKEENIEDLLRKLTDDLKDQPAGEPGTGEATPTETSEGETPAVAPKKAADADFKRHSQPELFYRKDGDAANRHLPIERDQALMSDALFAAATRGNINGIRAILDLGVDPNVENLYSNTPLFNAVLHNNLSAVRLLLMRGANPNKQNELGFTPLHMAAHQGNPYVISALLVKGANPNIYNNYDVSPLQLAVNSGHTEAIKVLLDNGARRETRFLSAMVQNDDMIRTVKKKTDAPVETFRATQAERDRIQHILDNMVSGAPAANPSFGIPEPDVSEKSLINDWKLLDQKLYDNSTDDERFVVNEQRKKLMMRYAKQLSALQGEDKLFWDDSMQRWDTWEDNREFATWLRDWRTMNEEFDVKSDVERHQLWMYAKEQFRKFQPQMDTLHPDVKKTFKQDTKRWLKYEQPPVAPTLPAIAPVAPAPRMNMQQQMFDPTQPPSQPPSQAPQGQVPPPPPASGYAPPPPMGDVPPPPPQGYAPPPPPPSDGSPVSPPPPGMNLPPQGW